MPGLKQISEALWAQSLSSGSVFCVQQGSAALQVTAKASAVMGSRAVQAC